MRLLLGSKLSGITFMVASILLAIYFYIFSYPEMIKLCGQLAYKGGALACLYSGPMSQYWTLLTAALLGFFILGAAIVLINYAKTRIANQL